MKGSRTFDQLSKDTAAEAVRHATSFQPKQSKQAKVVKKATAAKTVKKPIPVVAFKRGDTVVFKKRTFTVKALVPAGATRGAARLTIWNKETRETLKVFPKQVKAK